MNVKIISKSDWIKKKKKCLCVCWHVSDLYSVVVLFVPSLNNSRASMCVSVISLIEQEVTDVVLCQ